MITETMAELVVDLSFKNLALEKRVKELEEIRRQLADELTTCRKYMEEIGTLINYSGHPANIVGIIREKLKRGAVHEG